MSTSFHGSRAFQNSLEHSRTFQNIPERSRTSGWPSTRCAHITSKPCVYVAYALCIRHILSEAGGGADVDGECPWPGALDGHRRRVRRRRGRQHLEPLYVRDVEGIYARHISQLHAACKFFYGEADGIKMYKPYTYAIHGEADGTSLCI